MRFKIYKKMAPLLIAAIFLLVLDRLAKFLFHIYLPDKSFSMFGDVLSLRLATNDYIAFSIPFSGTVLEILIGVVLVLLLIGIIKYARRGQSAIFALLLMIFFGAVSNFYDRMAWGYVIDYIDLKWFTVFNIADAMIVISGVLLILKIKTGPDERPDTEIK